MLSSHEEFRVIVIRAWHERGAFRARMILQSDDTGRLDLTSTERGDTSSAKVVVTDSIDGLCTQLRAFLGQLESGPLEHRN